MPITRIEPKTSDTTVHSHDHWATIYCTYYYSNYTLFKQFWLFIVNLQLYRYVKAILLEVQNYFKISNLCMLLNGYTKKKDTAHFEFDISIHINYILWNLKKTQRKNDEKYFWKYQIIKEIVCHLKLRFTYKLGLCNVHAYFLSSI